MVDLENLRRSAGQIDFRFKRTGIHKILVPFFYEDGDMYDIFLEESPVAPDMLRISDRGLTIMKLSYVFDFDTDNKRDVLRSIISQNRVQLDNGAIFVDATPETFHQSLYQLLQTLTKVSNVDILSRDVIKSMFYDLLGEFVNDIFDKHAVVERFAPLREDDNLVVDYKINADKPIFLYGVKDDSKASKVVISCLNFQKSSIPFRSLIVHENLDQLNSFNKKQITNISDKQYWTLDDFKLGGAEYIQRELSVS